MKYRTIPNTDLSVSTVGFGLWTVSTSWWGAESDEAGIDLLRKAYDLGVATAANKARWGTFTVYLVTAANADAEVGDLLSDSHTGMLGTPSAGGIYWEQGVTLQGVSYWQAKRRYGQNVVVKWIGPTGAKKTDASWKRLHKALTAATK